MASLNVQSAPNALECTVTGLDPSHEHTRNFVWQAYLNGVMVVDEDTSAPPYSSGASFTMTGLTNGQTYQIQVGIYSEDWQTQWALLYGSGVPASPTPPGGGATIYTGAATGWKNYKPTIYTETGWKDYNATINGTGGWSN